MLTMFAFGTGGHGLDEDGADAMRQRLLALESEAGDMRRQLESLGVVAGKGGTEAENQLASSGFHGAVAELLLEFVVLLALGLVVYVVSRGSMVPPASKSKAAVMKEPACADSSWPASRVAHEKSSQPWAPRQNPMPKGVGNDAVWAALQKVTARPRIGEDVQTGDKPTSELPVGGPCDVLEPTPLVCLRPSRAEEIAEKPTLKAVHPWTRPGQEKLPFTS